MNFTVYKSSAGSGKTFTLVKEYLKLALADEEQPPQKYRHILAVTFTNKAAAEMKNRILQALGELSDGQVESVLAKMLVAETKIPSALLASRAQSVLKAILHHYGDFAVGTIDSFVHRIVRTFAYDLQIPVNFEIETDTDKLLREAVDLLIARIGSDEQLTDFLVQFAESKADDERNWQIEYELIRHARHLLGEDGISHADTLRKLSLADFAVLRDKLKSHVQQFEEQVQTLAQTAADACAGIEHGAFYQGQRGIRTWFEDVASGEFLKAGKPSANVRTAFEQNKRYAGKATEEQKDKVDRAWPRLQQAWEEIDAICKMGYGQYVLYALLLRNIHALAVLNEIEKELVSYKAENNVLHISEFNRLIAGIVLSEPVPFIYERLGERYHHYLIDEFQDTSVLQWQNLLPLVDNALSENRFTMLVGDGKQAIYRWRGGEVEQFARLPLVSGADENEHIAERAASLQRHYRGEQLLSNFRSKAEIVQFNNAFFRTLSETLGADHKLIYTDLEQEYKLVNTGGGVHLEVIDVERKEEKAAHAQRTLGLVEQLAKDGFRYSDIAVLTRTNREGSLVAAALVEAGVPVVSSESLLLKNAPKVNFLAALLRYLETPGDDIARASVVRFLVETGKLPAPLHERLAELREEGKMGLPGLLERNGFKFSTYLLAKLPLYQRCEELLRLFGIGEAPDPYVLFFLDEVLQYASGRNNNPADFLSWWMDRREKASVVMPEGMNAVRVMTIHKSKGLEFPAVILPFCNWLIKPGKDQIWLDLHDENLPGLETALVPSKKELLDTEYAAAFEEEVSRSLLDNLNVLYVALTRPEERLYVLTGRSNSKEHINTVNDLFARYFNAAGISMTESNVYETGEFAPHVQTEEPENLPITPTHFGSNDWTERISIRSNSGSAWADSIAEKDRQVLLRTLLQRIRTVNDLQHAIEQAVQEGLLDGGERKKMEKQLRQLIAQPTLLPCFDPENDIRIGAEIVSPDGTIFRAERIVLNGSKTYIVGYGSLADTTLAEQLEKCASLLTDMGNRSIVKLVVDTGALSVSEAV